MCIIKKLTPFFSATFHVLNLNKYYMRKIYLDIIYNYGPLIASIVSLMFFFSLVLKLKQVSNQKVAFLLLVFTSLISLEFYPYQILSFPLTILIPIGIIMLFVLKKAKKQYVKLINIMIIVFSLYLILGLIFLSSSANTWGDGPAPNGIFIVSNSIMILISLFTMQQKYFNLFIACQLLIGVVGFALIYYTTNGFYYGEYDWEDVRLRRNSSVLVCVISLLNGLLILIHIVEFNAPRLASKCKK